jgi:hypothetical protein
MRMARPAGLEPAAPVFIGSEAMKLTVVEGRNATSNRVKWFTQIDLVTDFGFSPRSSEAYVSSVGCGL